MTDQAVESRLVRILEESRMREKRQALFYRTLAAEAEWAERLEEAERLNGLHADEQHHLSRLTARVLELGAAPADLRGVNGPEPNLEGWEDAARERESDEVEWYEKVLGEEELDGETEALLREILEAEGHHREELGGKWMSA